MISTHAGVLCTFSNRAASDRASGVVHQGRCHQDGMDLWTVQNLQNHIPLGHSHPAMQPGGPPSWASPLAFGLIRNKYECIYCTVCTNCAHARSLPLNLSPSLSVSIAWHTYIHNALFRNWSLSSHPNLCQDFQPITDQNMHRAQCVLIIPCVFQAREK